MLILAVFFDPDLFFIYVYFTGENMGSCFAGGGDRAASGVLLARSGRRARFRVWLLRLHGGSGPPGDGSVPAAGCFQFSTVQPSCVLFVRQRQEMDLFLTPPPFAIHPWRLTFLLSSLSVIVFSG